MLNLKRPKLLALDRTNWKLGSRDVNVLVLAVVTRRFRVPLMWVLLDHAGKSATAQRIALMERYLRLFGAASIEALLADRAFIGAEWMEFLIENNIPFAIRLKEDMLIRLADGRRFQFRTLLRKRRRGAWEGWLNGMEATPANRLRIKARRVRGGELRIKATSLDDAGRGLNLYCKRWGIARVSWPSSASAPARITISLTTISTSDAPCAGGASTTVSSTTSSANIGKAATLSGTTRLHLRICLRQSYICQRVVPCLRATSATVTPCIMLSAAIRARSAFMCRRRPLGPSITSSRETLPSVEPSKWTPISPSLSKSNTSALCSHAE